MTRWPYLLWLGMLTATPSLADEAGDQAATISEADADMREAMARARDTLDDFLREFEHQPAGSSHFQLRVRINEGHASELLWVTQLQRDGEEFYGIIAHEPRTLTSLRTDQRQHFSRADIVDWGYVSNGKQLGGYTICAVLRRMAPQQADLYRREYRFDCN